MNTELRPEIRAVMQRVKKRRWTPAALRSALRSLHPDCTLEEVNAALQWNHAKGFVDYTFDSELECECWTITQRGLAAKV